MDQSELDRTKEKVRKLEERIEKQQLSAGRNIERLLDRCLKAEHELEDARQKHAAALERALELENQLAAERFKVVRLPFLGSVNA